MLRDGLAVDPQPRHQLRPGREHKTALSESRVRHRELRLADGPAAVPQQVEIAGPRPVSHRALAPELTFDLQAGGQQREGRLGSLDPGDRIEVIGLTGPPDGSRGVKTRDRGNAHAALGQSDQALAQLLSAVAEVRAESQKRLGQGC